VNLPGDSCELTGGCALPYSPQGSPTRLLVVACNGGARQWKRCREYPSPWIYCHAIQVEESRLFGSMDVVPLHACGAWDVPAKLHKRSGL
jgi:hypothetical protein